MAELASGAVSSLLGVIRNELALLGRVRGDVQFIQEEMESMHSFLEHLAQTVPPHGEHDPQVRTWMNQVRLLAQDCNNCIDLYLYRGNPDIHLAGAGLRRCLLWVPWSLNKTIAQHRAAVQLRELKERARDVGERRLRYGVEVPAKKKAAAAAAAGQSPLSSAAAPAAAAADDDDYQEGGVGYNQYQETATVIHPGSGYLFEPPNLDEYFCSKLVEWMEKVRKEGETGGATARSIPSVGIVTPDTNKDALALARDAWAVAATQQEYFKVRVLVDIPTVHLNYQRVRTWDTLYYTLRSLERASTKPKPGEGEAAEEEQQDDLDWRAELQRKWDIQEKKWELISKIYGDAHLAEMMNSVRDKIAKTEEEILQVKGKQLQLDLERMKDNKLKLEKEALGVLLVRLQLKSSSSSSDAEQGQDQGRNEAKLALALYGDIINAAAKKLEGHMGTMGAATEKPGGVDDVAQVQDTSNKQDEAAGAKDSKQQVVHLDGAQFEQILRQVFPMTSKSQQEQHTKTAAATSSTATLLGDDQIKEIVDKVKLEILREVFFQPTSNSMRSPLQTQEHERSSPPLVDKQDTDTTTATVHEDEGVLEILQQLKEKRSDKIQEQGRARGVQISDAVITETVNKMHQIQWGIQEQLLSTGIARKINDDHLKHEKTLIILKIDEEYDFRWEETRNALGLLLGCVAGAVIVTASKNARRAKQYCNPAQQEPLEFSYAGQYHDAVLRLTRPQQTTHTQMEQEDNSKYYDPQIFREILDKCDSHEFCMKIFAHALYAKPKRTHEELRKLASTLQQAPAKSLGAIAQKMLKFSYNDLPKEYMTCLLYLAIFPPGHKIRRSTLIGRWVAEGLVTTEEWSWLSSVQEAERCFDVLVNRWLIYPAVVGATGKVRSCVVGDQVHEFITKIAQKQRMVETRLSHHLARHFSVFNSVRLRATDTIKEFFKKLPESPQYTLLKVLDLEKSQSFDGKNKRDLMNICCRILLLKYLSLRGTDVAWLPGEINKLHELEVLDIRQTKVPPSETRNVRLLKLKRFLAGRIINDKNASSTTTGVQVPEKIEKMVDMEVLSDVEPQNSKDFRDIGMLWQLRKLGVVIKRESDLHDLFEAIIGNLHECLRSLSIALHITRRNGTRPLQGLTYPPKVLESLKISGNSNNKGDLIICLLAKHSDQLITLTKVTLHNTSLSKDGLKVLSDLPMLRCLRLRHMEYPESNLTFEQDKFKKLKYFLVEGSNMTDINFDNKAAMELEKIVLTLSDSLELHGLDKLQNLKELELNNNIKSSNNITSATAPSTLTDAEHETSPATTAPTTTTAAAPADATSTTPAVAPSIPTTDEPTTSPGTATLAAPTDAKRTTSPATTAPTSTAITNTAASAATPSVPTTDEPTTSPSAPTNPTTAECTTATPSPCLPTTAITKKLFSFLDNAKQIAKVTLHGTLMKRDDIQILSSKENIRSLVLLDKSFVDSELTFNKDEFPNLNLLTVNCSKITTITFNNGSSPRLDKIIWTFTKMESLSGIGNLPRLKQLEFNGDFVLDTVKQDIKKHPNRPYFTQYELENQDQVSGYAIQKYDVSKSPFYWKKMSWCCGN